MKRLFSFVLVLVLLVTLFTTTSMVFGQPGNKSFDTKGTKINDDLDAVMNDLQSNVKAPAIVIFNSQGAAETATGKVEKVTGKVEMKYKYENIPARAMKLSKNQILEFAKDPSVQNIQLDAEVRICMGTASNYFGASKARTDFGVTGDMDGNETSYTKNDVVVAVIDTGIDITHNDLDGGKVIAWKDWVSRKATTVPYDDNGHGTHCSGIIAGTGEGNSSYRGVAPGAALIGLKVLDRNGSGTMSNVDAAIDWCITNKSTYNIRVISMSLGTSGSSNGQDSTSLLVNSAFANGIVVCVAAGNSGPAQRTIGSPGAAADAITVAAMADPGEKGFSLAYFSSRGPSADGRTKPDISAPGYYIMSCQAGTPTGYVSMSGTSMATPFVAGTVALMIDANPSLTPVQVKSTITSLGVDWGPAGQDVDYGYGRLQTYEVVKSVGGFTGTGPAVPQHYYYTGSLSGTGTSNFHSISVTSTTNPIAVTFVIGNSSDFDIYLLDPSGATVASATGTTRQETINYIPTVTGTYQVKAYSYSGSGSYFFDASCN